MTAAGSTPITEAAPAALARRAATRSAPDVDDVVAVADTGQSYGEFGVGVAADVEAQRGDEAADTTETGVVGVMVGRERDVGLAGDRHVEHLDT